MCVQCSQDVKKCKSRELRASILYTSCDCIKRNGLQDSCPRSECQGQPACMVMPEPTCCPAKHAQRYINMRANISRNSDKCTKEQANKTCATKTASGCPQASSGGCPQPSSGGCPKASSGGCPHATSGGCPHAASGGCPHATSGGCPQASSGGCPHAASGGCPKPSTGGCPKANSGGCPSANTGGGSQCKICANRFGGGSDGDGPQNNIDISKTNKKDCMQDEILQNTSNRS